MTGGPLPQVGAGERADLVEVRLLRLPLVTHREASEHADELRREFTLIRAQEADDDAADVPRRLVALMEELEEQFSGYTDAIRLELDEAIERGQVSIDLVFRVPPEAGAAAARLAAMLDEADAHCRRGDALLTLATAPEALAYRRWYLEELTRQLDGLAPRPWTGP